MNVSSYIELIKDVLYKNGIKKISNKNVLGDNPDAQAFKLTNENDETFTLILFKDL